VIVLVDSSLPEDSEERRQTLENLTNLPGIEVRVSEEYRILDLMHVTAQGIVAGADMVLVDFHPAPARALVDGPQALLLKELPWFLEDVALARECYEKRRALAQRHAAAS